MDVDEDMHFMDGITELPSVDDLEVAAAAAAAALDVLANSSSGEEESSSEEEVRVHGQGCMRACREVGHMWARRPARVQCSPAVPFLRMYRSTHQHTHAYTQPWWVRFQASAHHHAPHTYYASMLVCYAT